MENRGTTGEKRQTEGHDRLTVWQKKRTDEENKESVVRGKRKLHTHILREEIVLRQRKQPTMPEENHTGKYSFHENSNLTFRKNY